MKRKGFTLIELLAVIVIVGLLVLLAVPAVSSIMQSSRKNTFKAEAISFIKDFDNAFVKKVTDGSTTKVTAGKVARVTHDLGYGEKEYYYLCMNLSDLVEEQFTKKHLGDNYKGYIEIYMDREDKSRHAYVSLTDGANEIIASEEELTSNDYQVKNATGSGSFTCSASLTMFDGVEHVDQKFAEYLRNIPSDNKQVVQDDSTADKNMRFIGNNPNNYVLFGCNDDTNPSADTCELWRIIGVFNSNSTGVPNELVKITKASRVDYYKFDDSTNVYSDSSVKDYLNDSNSKYVKSNMVETVTWKFGANHYGYVMQRNGPLRAYKYERGTLKTDWNGDTSWTGKVALPYYSDILLATNGNGDRNTSTSRSGCISNTELFGGDSRWKTAKVSGAYIDDCAYGSWFIDYAYDNDYKILSMSPEQEDYDTVYGAYKGGFNGGTGACYVKESQKVAILPTVYLKNDVLCENCDDSDVGTSSNPYRIYRYGEPVRLEK